MGASRVLCKWELEDGQRSVAIEPKGALAVDGYELLLDAAVSGAGLAYIVESSARAAIADGRLVQVLGNWSMTLPGFFLYYPSGRHMPSALRALIDFFRFEPA
jgi:DNA-binding transcriptional LysR family regulator